MTATSSSRRCGHLTADGRPCKAWAIRGSDPPRCSAHAGRNAGAGAPCGNQNRRTHGFYSSALLPEELADLVACADDITLDDEIATTRVTLRRILALLSADGRLTAEDYARLATLALAGARTVARLLRDKRALSGDAADGLIGAVATALDELGTELGIDL
jgi:hypothetical protein